MTFMTAQNTLIIDICYFKLQYQSCPVKSPDFLVTFYNSLTEKENFFEGEKSWNFTTLLKLPSEKQQLYRNR